jgi:hypothetical protein
MPDAGLAWPLAWQTTRRPRRSTRPGARYGSSNRRPITWPPSRGRARARARSPLHSTSVRSSHSHSPACLLWPSLLRALLFLYFPLHPPESPRPRVLARFLRVRAVGRTVNGRRARSESEGLAQDSGPPSDGAKLSGSSGVWRWRRQAAALNLNARLGPGAGGVGSSCSEGA